jgi:hypothetical protein
MSHGCQETAIQTGIIRTAARINQSDSIAKFGRTPIALPVNVDLILFLILTVINWVEGVLKFTYVESK